MEKLFPRKVTKHEHNLRNPDDFETNYARTNRYKNSAVPYMQKLLNEDAKKLRAYKS